MANKNDFTPEEWTKVLDSIMVAGIAVSAADPSGLWGTLKEAAASSLALAAAKSDPNSNELIKAAIADFERSDEGGSSILAMRERFAQAEPAECIQRSLASLSEVSAIVDAKAPDEAAAFKIWLCPPMGIARNEALPGSQCPPLAQSRQRDWVALAP